VTLATFVAELRAALPQWEEWAEPYDVDPELSYPTLSACLRWLMTEVLDRPLFGRKVTVRPGREDDMRAFWAFVERATAEGDRDVHTLLQIELFEGIYWTEDVVEWLGPRTRALLDEARVWLRPYNRSVGRRGEPD
jgi:hypothetical protein